MSAEQSLKDVVAAETPKLYVLIAFIYGAYGYLMNQFISN